MAPMVARKDSGPRAGARRIQIRSPETKRSYTFDVDADLDPNVLQRLNDLAFAYGFEIVSTCAGHGAQVDDDLVRSFAEIRFNAFYERTPRIGARRLRLCIEALARAVAGDHTVIEVMHDAPVDRGRRASSWSRRLRRTMLIARHSRPTLEDPIAAQAWWDELVERLSSNISQGVTTLSMTLEPSPPPAGRAS